MQSEQLLERIEVAVAVQERMTLPEAERGDQAVNRFANGATLRTESAVVACSRCREIDATCLEDRETPKIAEHASGFLIGREPLENLTDHEVDQSERLSHELLIEPLRLWCRDVVEVVDPDRRINDDHRIRDGWRRVRDGSRSDCRST